ncbi:MAG: NAD(P)-dependent oxidoreductase [Acidimicrobiales bacterium]
MADLPKLYIDRPLPEGFEDLFDGRAEVVGPEEEALDSADGVIAGASSWHADRIRGLGPSVKVISRSGIGYDTVDLDAATAHGVVICNAPDAPTVSTAEHAVALMFAAAKGLTLSQSNLRSGGGDYFVTNTALELEGRVLGLIAYGRIARRVGAVGRALGMEVLASDPYLDQADVELVDLETLLSRADVVSVHAPLTDQTRHLFDASAFAQVKPGIVFVNTARGGLVDQEALLAALDSGAVAFAALDVTEPEPLPTDHPLLAHPRCMVTPHIASATDRGKRRLYDHAISNALEAVAGQRLVTCVNPEVYGE